MLSNFWIVIVLFFVGFFHGLHSDHVQEILARYDRDKFYLQMTRLSLEEIMDHLRLFCLVLLPLVLLRLIFPGMIEFTFLPFLAFLFFAIVNFYLFFFRKVSLHQHDHDHSHSHSHDHLDESPVCPESHDHADEEEKGHGHDLPLEMDRPQETIDHHSHDHDHSHSHLHIHHAGKAPKHQHQHYPGIWGRILQLRNLSILFLLAATIIVLPIVTGGMMVGVFLLGSYLSLYLLSLIYIAGGISLMERCISFSDLLSGTIAFLVLFFL